jgi:hypothetical protein
VRLPKKDVVATGAVAVAVALYLLWLADVDVLGTSTRIVGLVVLLLGFVASASAVVPGFTGLLHGSKVYLAVTSLLGLAALAAGIVTLWSASPTALAVLVGALVLLWAISTAHHVALARAATCPECGATVTESTCEVCGYDLVRRARGEAALHKASW